MISDNSQQDRLAQMMLPLEMNRAAPQLNVPGMAQTMAQSAISSAPIHTNPDIKIELDNADLWRKFHQHTTEMIVNKTGRRMFPTLKFKITGLEPSTSYAVFLEIAPLDECRYKFQTGRWLINGRADPLPQSALGSRTRLYSHPDSPAPGHLWMRQPISFHRIKLTNNILDPQGNVLLNSMHKYQPRLYVMKLHDYFPTIPQMVACASFPESAFVTVTAYQNNSIIQLKIDHNPFAKGFREHGMHSDKKRPPSSNELQSEASGPAKRLCFDDTVEQTNLDDSKVTLPVPEKSENSDTASVKSEGSSAIGDSKHSDTDSNVTGSPLNVSVPSLGPSMFSPSQIFSPVKQSENHKLCAPIPTMPVGFPGPMQLSQHPTVHGTAHFPQFLTPPFSPVAGNLNNLAALAQRLSPLSLPGFNPTRIGGGFGGMVPNMDSTGQSLLQFAGSPGGILGGPRVNSMEQAHHMLMAAAANGGFSQGFFPNTNMFGQKL